MKRQCIGERFGRLVVLGDAPSTPKHRRVYCLCDCGKETVVFLAGLTALRHHTTSCGCVKIEQLVANATTHGLCNTPGYNSWLCAKRRCTTPTNPAYHNYGGRGIAVCDRWLHDFGAFIADMGPPPTSKHTLERVDNDGPYAPDNCRWALRAEQLRNTRRTRHLTYQGETMCAIDWARRLGIPSKTLHYRLRHGWPTVLALTAPMHFRPRK